MFTCYPKYNINLGDKDFDNSLSLYFKFLSYDFRKEDNNVMTMYDSAFVKPVKIFNLIYFKKKKERGQNSNLPK